MAEECLEESLGAALSVHVLARASVRFGFGGIVTTFLSGVVVVRSRPVFVS